MSFLTPPKLLTPHEYAKDLVNSINNAKSEIAIVTTTIRDDDNRTHDIIEALCKASDKGVAVTVYADTYTYLEPKEFILVNPKKQSSRAFHAVKLERKLKSHGVSFTWLGRKSNILLTGRTHCKWAVVDSIVYSFGGINLDKESFDNIDCIIKINDSRLALYLIDEQIKIRRADKGGSGIRNHTYELSPDTTILFDGGLIGGSLIYRRTCKLSLEAKSIKLVSQYCPTGPLNRILKFKDAKLFYNHWRNALWINRVMIGLGMLTSRSVSFYNHGSYLHAKFAIFTMNDGKKVALLGSHNFMHGSGLLGTREIALQTTDVKIIKQLESFHKNHIE